MGTTVVFDVEKHIKEIEAVIASNDQAKAKEMYDKLLDCYKDQIPCYEVGTNALFVKTNLCWNFNDGIDWIDEEDYINDLKIVLTKIRKHHVGK